MVGVKHIQSEMSPILTTLKIRLLDSRQRLMLEVIFLLPIIVAVAMFGRLAMQDVFFTVILSIIFMVNLVIRFLVANQHGDIFYFLLGIIAGGGNDLLSISNGVYDYTSLTVLPFLSHLMPIWMVAFWGQVFLLFRKIFNVDWFAGVPFKQPGGVPALGEQRGAGQLHGPEIDEGAIKCSYK